MRVLELGSYVAPAYAGMVLAEQGHDVLKWTNPAGLDPIQTLRDGDALWEWINHGKRLQPTDIRDVRLIQRWEGVSPDVVLDNVRAATWERWGINPAEQARRLGVAWVSLRDDFDGRGFDAIAQARAWGDHVGYIPTYIGDTSAGLWMAFKALAMRERGVIGHAVLRQGACLAKLVEGELVVPAKRDGRTPPWDEPGTYGPNDAADRWDGEAPGTAVEFKGERVYEPFRDDDWRREHLAHDNGRYRV